MPKSFIVEVMGRRLEVVQDDDGKFVVPVGFRGLGGALKPAFEPALLFRKPLQGTVAENVMAHGTGALNIDGCRVPTDDKLGGGAERAETSAAFANEGWRRPWMNDPEALERQAAKTRQKVEKAEAVGRFPANVILSYSEDEYELRSGVTAEQRKELLKFLYENA